MIASFCLLVAAQSPTKMEHRAKYGPPLALEVATEKASYRVGETIRVVARLRNVSGQPRVVARTFGLLNTTPQRALLTLKVSSTPERAILLPGTIGSYFVGGQIEIEEGDFAVLPPGQRLVVLEESFSEYWTDGKQPDTKADFAEAPRAKLPAGTYRVTVTYDWSRQEAQQRINRRASGIHGLRPGERPRPGRRVVFTEKGQRMFDQAVEAKLTATTTFTVK